MFHFKKIRLFGFEKQQQIEDFEKIIDAYDLEVVSDAEDADLIIVLGGDGSILHMAKYAHQYQIPILGINLGHIGFLADVSLTEIDVIKAILKGNYVKDYRQVLKCRIGSDVHYAINEVMVSKSKSIRMIRYEVHVDDQLLYDQTADGLIVATTTGSSAYALSAGGQLIHPSVKALSLVPICPNKITSCPMVINDSSKIDIVLKDWKGSESCVACDAIEVATNQSFSIEVDPKSVTFLHPVHYNYYQTLQKKLGWEVDTKKEA